MIICSSIFLVSWWLSELPGRGHPQPSTQPALTLSQRSQGDHHRPLSPSNPEREQGITLHSALTLWVACSSLLQDQPPAPRDYTQIEPRELGVTLVEAKKDPKTGFLLGGKNSTQLIRKLAEIAGRTVAALEADMRPGGLSTAGFLGKQESLLEVLAADNRYVVEELGLTHQTLARHLHVLGAIAAKQAAQEPLEILYHGQRYRLQAQFFRGKVNSPFEDGTSTNCEAALTNLNNGKQLRYSLLVPHLIERYGFYEGHGTRYRVEPRAIIEVCPFMKKAKKSSR